MLNQFVGDFLAAGMPVLVPAGLGAVGLLLLWFMSWIFRETRARIRRSRAGAELGIRLPQEIRAKPAKEVRGIGAFVLVYPRWKMAKKDGTRDRRYRNNEVVKGHSVLELGRWRLVSRSVIRLYDLVIELRSRGHAIALSSEEADKLNRLNFHDRARSSQSVGDDLHQRFAGDPTQFEYFCAELYHGLGYRVEITPPVADGGFGLRMFRDGQKTLVECKCFKPANSVGRPILQRLFGANAVEGADHLILVATATFSGEAIAYAREVGMELVDGSALVALCSRAWGICPSAPVATAQRTRLSLEDHLSRVPADIRDVHTFLG